ncbi:phosphorylating glyceraldehyde-3-phosphate dehydrogenase [Pyrococcus abyssi]|uniref:Glyceraldehyde-3-phosphate dehydrogenase n=1 Tax=Pyrococcus abyssi (strain GE5 / Orsay) TaxID=272844 RepID=G3P_PYRAB|nr:phosphorylating glyceraldehyde-3-phosphate dehydrogenase [Pyrococcus abyssi]Q9V1P1.1 RecName: Full=Glyceraldehyde-3-phosphate dehydrogenase; Short=GAPDH; AltName: Full=NAD(P)-dependent glyceraldehyde-3-phosphate dehydrogenase [Pyrococcus abyssi GE5]CAB49308.1 gap glyceraldehyde 3-phosphate dehydrogenase [Pyrococcus abyssi GE5]CCE69764.1 TPA: glyceraldehyde-3-phosphate dehydrogenase [Pyrococcus abyssi GE5]
MKVKVGVNGYGTIGKRVAYAITKQDDMELVGVVKTKPDFEAYRAKELGIPVYAANEEFLSRFESVGFEVEGTLNDLLEKVDVIVDATPGGVGAKNKPLYEKAGVKAVFQGGEKANVAEVSFVAQANYEKALGKSYVRVVSCNTTGLVRTLNAIREYADYVYAVMIRRAADPNDIKRGPINAIKPSVEVPSHHGPDVQTVIPINIETMAFVVPTTIMHVHSVMVELKKPLTREDVIDIFENTTRVLLFEKEKGFESTAQIIEFARDLHREWNNLYEIAVWKESINVKGNRLYYIQAVHQESDVVPENVDAIRAMFELADKEESIKKTNKSLGILK